MKNTAELRTKMLELWKGFDDGNVSAVDARIHIGFARVALDSLKVEIAKHHMEMDTGPAVEFAQDPTRTLPKK